jgi:XTP/dITP diphosphohydrolase
MAMGKVEGKLAELGPDADRSAHFISTLVLAWPDGHHEIFEGRAYGHLVWPPRGKMGFGYDPVFVPAGYMQSYAELDPAQKLAINHRTRAFEKLTAILPLRR